jgi:hypothetical protein
MPWYPSVRVFRQPRYGEWEPVIERVADELQRRAGTPAQVGASVMMDKPGREEERLGIKTTNELSMRNQTISEEYLKLQQDLHQNPKYGVASLSFAPIVADLIRKTGVGTLSDYGAGKKNLLKGLTGAGITNIEYFPYDPAFPEYGEPKQADLVCCIDVLEHIEPEMLDAVIKELASITRNLGFFSIHMGPAAKFLADGRNAHLIQEPSSWWLKKLVDYFEILHLQSHQMMGNGIWLVVKRKASI